MTDAATRTPDLGGTASTELAGDAVIGLLARARDEASTASMS